MIRSTKEPANRKASGLAHLMSALHQNAAAVVNSKTQLNGPDQILPGDNYFTSRRNSCVKLRREDHGLGSEEPVSVPTLLTECVRAFPEVIALRVKRNGEEKMWTYEQLLLDVQLAARGFLHLGAHRHHAVAIIASNSPEWIIAHLAAIFAGSIALAQCKFLTDDDIAKEALDAKADIVVVENEDLLQKIMRIQHKLPELKAVVQIKGEPPLADKRRLHRTHKKHIISWSQLLEVGRELPEARLDERQRRIAINQCCSLVYSAGKGVMLSHDNLTWCAKMVLGLVRPPGFNRFPLPGEEVLLSYIPLVNVSAQIIDIYYTITVVGTLCFVDEGVDISENTSALFEVIAEVEPSVFVGPLRIYELLYHRFREMKRLMSGAQRLIVDWSNKALRDKHMTSCKRPSSGPKKLRNAVAKKAVSEKYKDLLGFSQRTVFLCHGSPMVKEIFQYLAGFDIVVHEVFGQAENCGLLSANIPKRYIRPGTAGKAVPGTKARIMSFTDSQIKAPAFETEDLLLEQVGDICNWGRNVFMGYLNKDNDTKSTFSEDHWLRMGHVGGISEDGFIAVQGKMQDFLTLSSGQVVAPAVTEQLIRLELPCVEKVAVVLGQGHEHLIALIWLRLEPVVDGRRLESGDLDEPGNVVTEEVDIKVEPSILDSDDEDSETEMYKAYSVSGVKLDESAVLDDDSRRWFRQARFDLRTVGDVIAALQTGGLKHVIQAGIDRANQKSGAIVAGAPVRDWALALTSTTPNTITSRLTPPRCSIECSLDRVGLMAAHENLIGIMHRRIQRRFPANHLEIVTSEHEEQEQEEHEDQELKDTQTSIIRSTEPVLELVLDPLSGSHCDDRPDAACSLLIQIQEEDESRTSSDCVTQEDEAEEESDEKQKLRSAQITLHDDLRPKVDRS